VPYLLDTNACIAAMRNQPQIVQRLSAASPAECFVSTVTSYELFTGVAKCAMPEKERLKVETLLRALVEIPFDSAASQEAGRIRAILESQGKMIGPYDVLLAGQAVAAGLTLVTDNTSEFGRVPGLALENWQNPKS